MSRSCRVGNQYYRGKIKMIQVPTLIQLPSFPYKKRLWYDPRYTSCINYETYRFDDFIAYRYAQIINKNVKTMNSRVPRGQPG